MPGESHGQRSLEGYRPWGCIESDTSKATLHAHTEFRKTVLTNLSTWRRGRCRENSVVDTEGEGESGMSWESSLGIYALLGVN